MVSRAGLEPATR